MTEIPKGYVPELRIALDETLVFLSALANHMDERDEWEGRDLFRDWRDNAGPVLERLSAAVSARPFMSEGEGVADQATRDAVGRLKFLAGCYEMAASQKTGDPAYDASVATDLRLILSRFEGEGVLLSQPCGEASADAEVFAGLGAEPAASAEATELLEIVTARADAYARKAADGLYAQLLEATQDYLIDNARFNIGSTMDGLKRQAQHDREAWGKAEARAASLTDALKHLWLATASGTENERVVALSAAGDLLARIGALGSNPKEPGS